MPNPTLSDALAEAYASAPAARPIVDTLSVYYDGLVDALGQPTEVFVYCGYHGDRTNAAGVLEKDFRLEPAARVSGGLVVPFINVPFTATLPKVSGDSIAKGQLVLDGVGREISRHLLAAVALGASIEVTYRAYLAGLEDDGPQNDPPLVFALENVSATPLQVKGDIALPNMGNKRFPGALYDTERFPAIR